MASHSRDSEHRNQSVEDPVSKSGESENLDQSVEDPLSKSSDDERIEHSFDDILRESIDDGHGEQNFDGLSSKSDDKKDVKQASDDSHTDEVPIAIHPRWQEEVYDDIEQTLKDIALGLNNIPLGLLRSEHLSQWTFDNPSRDAPTTWPELLLEQQDFTEEERANRIMDWLDKRFPHTLMEKPFVSEDNTEMSGQAEGNGSASSEGTNPRWFYTEIDFHQWIVQENRSSQGGHPRGSFVKKGGDWRCVSAKVPEPLLQSSC